MNRRGMRAAAREAVKTWPPLTEDQKVHLRVLLRPDLPAKQPAEESADADPTR